MRRTRFHWPVLTTGVALLAAAVLAVETNSPPRVRAPLPPFPGRADWRHLNPVEYFRGLLGMNAAEREKALANKSPAERAVILAKLKEYDALPRPIREARLCQTELHWALMDLMKLAPAERTNRLKEVSVLYRPMVQSLLQQWDLVPADTQKALLENQSFISVYLRMQGSPAAAQQEILDKLPSDRRAHWVDEMNRWQALPESQRSDLCAQFQRFFSMSGQEKKETVDALSESERQQMEKVLQSFDRLPPAQRAQCISSFGRFAIMSPGEQMQFFKNAARWDAMTSHERQLWRQLVHTLPPMPPMPKDAIKMPPMPPTFRAALHPPPPLPNVTTPVIVVQSRY